MSCSIQTKKYFYHLFSIHEGEHIAAAVTQHTRVVSLYSKQFNGSICHVTVHNIDLIYTLMGFGQGGSTGELWRTLGRCAHFTL